MSPFQLIGVLLLGTFVALSARSHVRGRSTRRAAIAWSTLWIAAAFAIVEPGVTVWVARRLGIGRGADLVLYCTVLATGVGFFVVYARMRQLETSLTKLVRHLALRDPLDASPTGPASPPPGDRAA